MVGELQRTIAARAGVVSLVIAYTNADAGDARMAVLRALAGAVAGAGFKVLHIFNAVFDEVRLLEAGQLQ